MVKTRITLNCQWTYYLLTLSNGKDIILCQTFQRYSEEQNSFKDI